MVRTYGVNLSFPFDNFHLWWYALRGMRLNDMRQTLYSLYASWPPPQIVIIHISGNDIGNRHTLDIISQLKFDFIQLHSVLPHSILVFSEIVPRLTWLLNPELKHCEKIRKKINRAMAKFMPYVNGLSYRHIDLEGGLVGFYRSDAVHLSDIALDVFNVGIQNCIELAVGQVGCQAHL